MGFETQPYLEVEHEKFGKDGVLRRHRHIITATADATYPTTRPDSVILRQAPSLPTVMSWAL